MNQRVCKLVLVVAASYFCKCWFQCWYHQYRPIAAALCMQKKKEKKKQESISLEMKFTFPSSFRLMGFVLLNSVVTFQVLLQGILPPFPWEGGNTGSFQLCSSTVQAWAGFKKSVFLKCGSQTPAQSCRKWWMKFRSLLWTWVVLLLDLFGLYLFVA